MDKEKINYSLIDSRKGLESFFAGSAKPAALAFDLEADGLFSYEDKICLVQLSYGGRTAIVDPLKEADILAPVTALLLDPSVEKIAHGADYDVRLLKKRLGVSPVNLFDTMIAAQLLGYERLGLNALMEVHFGIILDKRHQRADWSKRPLTPDMLDYAAADVTHLERLSDILKGELAEKGRTAWAAEEFALLLKAEVSPAKQPSWKDVKGSMKLKGVELAVLQALVEVRDETARARNRPVFKVIPNDALMAWAAKPPETSEEVVNTPGVSRHYMERLAPSILKAIKGALALSPEEWPQKPPPEPRQVLTPEETKALDKLKAARAKTAEELGIDPGLLGNTAMLTRLAKTSREDFEQVLKKELKNWQMEVAGGALLAALD